MGSEARGHDVEHLPLERVASMILPGRENLRFHSMLMTSSSAPLEAVLQTVLLDTWQQIYF